MNLIPLNGLLFGLVAATTVMVMASWWISTGGAWMRWPAGRSLMGLLAIIALITVNATLSVALGPAYPAKPLVYTVMYLLLWAAVLVIGATIMRVQRAANEKRKTTAPAEPGPTKKEESHG